MPVFSIELLRLLSDGQLHSGEEIGQLLCVSRAAIWKQIQKLEAAGFNVESQKGSGYRLVDKIDLLECEVIAAAIPRSSILSLHIHPWMESTSLYLQQHIQSDDVCHGLCIAAEAQTGGRGRRGNAWVSPFAQNLYFSLLWRFEAGLSAIEGLSLVVGISIVKTLRKKSIPVQLKWPNDILLEGKKLGGILIDVVGESNGPCKVVIGIGLNVYMQKGAGISQVWTSLAKAGWQINRSTLLAEILVDLEQELLHFTANGFTEYHLQWQQYDAYLGKEAMLILADKSILGQVMGINLRGEITLKTNDVEASYASGEVSLRVI